MVNGPASEVEFLQTDIRSAEATTRAYTKPWPPELCHLPLTVFHTAIAHLDFEAILASPDSFKLPQAGRPFVITDPNPPIEYGDLYFLIKTLAITRFHVIPVPPIVMVFLSYVIEAYTLLRLKGPWLQCVMPPIVGDIKHLKPAIFSICSHLVASNDEASEPVAGGGLGYAGVLTTVEGMVQEVVEWNHIHRTTNDVRFQSSVSLADEIQKTTSTSNSTGGGGARIRNSELSGCSIALNALANPGYLEGKKKTPQISTTRPFTPFRPSPAANTWFNNPHRLRSCVNTLGKPVPPSDNHHCLGHPVAHKFPQAGPDEDTDDDVPVVL